MPKRNNGLLASLWESALKLFKWILSLPKRLLHVKWSQNTGKKMLSVVLALLFWLFVMDQEDPEINRVFENVPVQLINLQELDQNNLKIMNQYDYFVNVEVTGRRNTVLNMNENSISLWADMRTVRAGSNNVYINRSINTEAVSIKSVLPNEVSINVERIVSIPKPVKITITDRFSESYFQEKLSVSPSEIKVSGPESQVAAVSYLGASLAVGTLESDLSREVTILPYDENGEVVSGVVTELSYADIYLSLGRLKNVGINVDVQGNPMEGYEIVSIRTIPESIAVSGQVDAVAGVETLVAEAVTLSGDEDSTVIVEKDLIMPDGVTAQSHLGPIQVEIIIEQIQSKEFTFDIIDLPIVNLDDAFTYEILDLETPITVKVSDIESLIEPLVKDDLRLDLNLSNVDRPGIYRLKINVTSDETYKEVEINPLNIEVNVTEKNAEE